MPRCVQTPLIVWCAVAICGALYVASPVRADVIIFVSPSGNDASTGERAEATAGKTDGPVATPQRARDLARVAGDRHQPIRIMLAGGTYFLHEPLVLTPEDSGTADAPILWTSDGKTRAILSAGRRLTGFEKTSVNGHGAWMLKLPAGDGALACRELWINGRQYTRARWPKKGTFGVPKVKEKNNEQWNTPGATFPIFAGDLKDWPSGTAGEVVMMSRWVDSRLPIAKIDLAANVVHTGKLAGFSPETNDRYYIENVKETLSEPGEWVLDPRENVLYLIAPRGVSSPDEAEVIAPVFAEILRLNGDVAAKKYIEHLTFAGITFSHNQWYYDHVAAGEKSEPERSSSNQADVGVPGAIAGEGVRSCIFDHCTIAHAGSYGIQLGRGCQHNRITHCLITDLAAGGVKIGEMAVRDDPEDQAFDNEISDCRITDGGSLFPSAVGVWIGQSHDNTLSHNEIGGFWYTGISVGWTWGYGKALSQNNHIESNEIHHIGMKHDGDAPILSDMGGIYTLGNEHGTIIRNNVFHDIAGMHYGGWGIYFDEGTTDILAENNLVYRTTHGGFHQHYGKDNVVRNNIFAFGRDMQIQRTRLEDHTSFTFEHNIVYWDSGTLLTGNWSKLNAVFDYNTYWDTRGNDKIRFERFAWDEWRKQGMDEHSQIADPGFKDPQHGDFHFTGKPPEGFVPFEWSDAGPRK